MSRGDTTCLHKEGIEEPLAKGMCMDSVSFTWMLQEMEESTQPQMRSMTAVACAEFLVCIDRC